MLKHVKGEQMDTCGANSIGALGGSKTKHIEGEGVNRGDTEVG